jgi:hypothetical protein
MVDRKEDCVLLILLIDLLWCFDDRSFQLTSNQRLPDLLALYEKCETKSEIIDTIVECFSKPDLPDSPNIPNINFELIYTIINLATTKIGLCLTIPEIIVDCG